MSGSLVTVISIAYSITILAIQQTSAQFSPRVLRTLTSDRGNQVVLGTYIGTFVYALLVLRQIRGTTDTTAAFVPPLSITAALGLALVCLGLLIYFLDHIAHLLQVSVIIATVHRELIAECDRLFPAGNACDVTEPVGDLAAKDCRRLTMPSICARQTADFSAPSTIDCLVKMTDGRTPWLRVIPQVGDYVPHEGVLVQYPQEAKFHDRAP